MQLKKSVLMLAFLASTLFCNAQDLQGYGGFVTQYWADTATFGGAYLAAFEANRATAQSYLTDNNIKTGTISLDEYNSTQTIKLEFDNSYYSTGGNGDIMIFLMDGTISGTANTMSLILSNGQEAGSFTSNFQSGTIPTAVGGYEVVNLESGASGSYISFTGAAKILKFSDFGLTAAETALGVKGIKFIDSNFRYLDLMGVAFNQNVAPISPVPEPSAAMLIGMTASLFLLRRRRHNITK